MRINNRNNSSKRILTLIVVLILSTVVYAQSDKINVKERQIINLNGDWNAIIDPTGVGDWRQVWLEKKPVNKTDFYEYSFEGSPILKVPGDFNSQMRELTYYESIVWYKKQFNYTKKNDNRLFLNFGSVNYLADVYLNGEKLGSHEGGFTPFQFEITDKVKEGENSLIVKVDNHRVKNGLPGLGYDWLNYGGITGDVSLISTSVTFVEEYSIQLQKGSLDEVAGWVKLNGPSKAGKNITIKIPELNIEYKTLSNDNGVANVNFKADFELWSPESPKLYNVIIETESDVIADEIGFRSIEVKGPKVLLNGKPIFLKGVNIHAENPYKKARAYSKDDALILLNAAKELGCNLIRLAHYPHSENMVKAAEKMGIMVWSELPIYQHIEFADHFVPQKMETMLQEMISRDRNRCGIVIWSLSNETYPDSPNRTQALIELTQKCKATDSTRLIVHVINSQGYSNNTFNVWDTLYSYSDLIAINEYIGWYIPWQGNPKETKWRMTLPDKPVFISEFGGEALYGNNDGPTDEAAFWTEEYQKNIYTDQLKMLDKVPNLCGICPWLLFDYRSPGRMNQLYQKGYNRKGLLSENGEKKKAWYVMMEYYKNK
jgi:beta-glucuronidase